MANTAPIDTQTDTLRIPVNAQLNDKIKEECDTMGAAGHQLAAAFALGNDVILIFQLTR